MFKYYNYNLLGYNFSKIKLKSIKLKKDIKNIAKHGVKFRLVVSNKTAGRGLPTTKNSGAFPQLPITSSSENIITFYSDRNFKRPMKFENPKLNEKI